MSQPIIERDDYWADFWNSLFMRPVYRKPFPSTAKHSVEAPAQTPTSEAEPKAQEATTKERTVTQSPTTSKDAKVQDQVRTVNMHVTDQTAQERTSPKTVASDRSKLAAAQQSSQGQEPDEQVALLLLQLEAYLAGKDELEIASLAQSVKTSLPDVDGQEVLERIRQFSQAYLHLLTARHDDPVWEKLSNAEGMDAQSILDALPSDVASPITMDNGGAQEETTAKSSPARSGLAFERKNETAPSSTPPKLDEAQKYAGYAYARATMALDAVEAPDAGSSAPTENEVLEQILVDIRNTFNSTEPGSRARGILMNSLIRQHAGNIGTIGLYSNPQQEGSQRVGGETRRDENPGQ